MSLILVGLNHRTAPVELREQFTLTGCGVPMALAELKKLTAAGGEGGTPCLREAAVLSTCNRFEVYAIGSDDEKKFEPLEEFLITLQATPMDEVREHFYYMEDRDALGHLMKVSAGVDSMVVGEPQILGQVNEAFRDAMAAKTLGPMLNQAFNRVIRVGKRARTETSIGRYTTSVSHAAVHLAESKLGDLTKKHVAIIGAGDMAELAGKELKDHGAERIAIVNRTHSRSVALADQIGARPMAWHELNDVLKWADLVFTATDAPHTLIYANEIEPLLVDRNARPLLFVDIAMPRDVEPAVADLDGVHVLDIDELQSVVDDGMEQRMAAVPEVDLIVEAEVQSYYDWIKSRDVTPVIVDLRAALGKLVSEEVEAALRSMEDPKDREIVERLRHRVVNKILHEPSTRLKAFAANGNGIAYADAIREVFSLDQRNQE